MELTLFEKAYLHPTSRLVLHGLRKLKIPTDWLFEKKHDIIMRYLESNHHELINRYLTITPPN